MRPPPHPELLADKRRLEWLCEYITSNGLDGMQKIAWSVYDDDGKSLMHRKTVSEDEVGEIRFDRAAIDAAMSAPAVPALPVTDGGVK